jgi:hypothetical protein
VVILELLPITIDMTRLSASQVGFILHRARLPDNQCGAAILSIVSLISGRRWPQLTLPADRGRYRVWGARA